MRLVCDHVTSRYIGALTGNEDTRTELIGLICTRIIRISTVFEQ